ncbi:MAG: sigma-E processing peptidase SpoIIGA [Candidatus Carbobacillus altaicus]|nr:sigma-E processing peptidase SpoIIGA [Candidatus Carbobacillus altaicus]
MGEVIYLDLVFLNDFLTSLFILWMTAFLWRRRITVGRLLLGSLLGSAGTFGLIVPFLYGLYTPLGKISFLLLLLAVTFFPRTLSEWVYGGAYLLLANALYVGLTFFMTLFTERLPDVFPEQVTTGLVAFVSPSLWTFLWAFLVMVVLSRLVFPVLVWRFRKESFYVRFTLFWEGAEKTFTGYVDTGNTLNVGGRADGVALIRLEALLDMLPEDLTRAVRLFYAGKDKLTETFVTPRSWEKWGRRLRLIPYRAIGKEGILFALRFDLVTIRSPSDRVARRLTGRTVAIVLDDFGLGEGVDALIPPDWVQEGKGASTLSGYHIST